MQEVLGGRRVLQLPPPLFPDDFLSLSYRFFLSSEPFQQFEINKERQKRPQLPTVICLFFLNLFSQGPLSGTWRCRISISPFPSAIPPESLPTYQHSLPPISATSLA